MTTRLYDFINSKFLQIYHLHNLSYLLYSHTFKNGQLKRIYRSSQCPSLLGPLTTTYTLHLLVPVHFISWPNPSGSALRINLSTNTFYFHNLWRDRIIL